MTLPGLIELSATQTHRVRVHDGAPTRGACNRQSFLYTHGDVDVLPVGFADAWHEQDAGASLLLDVPPALLRRAAEDMGLDPARAGVELRHQIRDPQIEHLARALDAHQRAGSPSGRLYEDCLGLALAVHLLGRYPAPSRSPRGLSKPQLSRLTEFIGAHLDQELSLERLAAVVGISASHLKTLFKHSTGLPVHAYVTQARVQRARALLQGSDLPASQVALEAGFAHQSHMARCMRRVLGVVPTSIARPARSRRERELRRAEGERAHGGAERPA
ncbi:MAG: Transcriptional regulator [Myxococcaceae bacterium]|nr:Transcriptional regulator [Myxococcaceae bacterium]